jgi:hypothetical protein
LIPRAAAGVRDHQDTGIVSLDVEAAPGSAGRERHHDGLD